MSLALQHPAPPTVAALPDTGERIPTLSWPIVAIFVAAITAFAASTWAALTAQLPAAATIVISAAAIFVLFTVLHDASHYSVSRYRWVNVAFGRVSMFFVSPLISFKSFAFIHIEHHLNTNDGDNDPDHFVTGGPRWQLPLRFPIMDLPYLGFLARNLNTRPRSEIAETAALMTASVAAITVAALTGHLWMLAVTFLIPGRVAVFVLAWWFDWLPHHDLPDTQRENRYRATRNRVGSEWILTPLLLSQNYHLVHHLHPSIPFYRYVAAWRRNEDAYLDRDPALITALGQQLEADEYRRWTSSNGRLSRLLPLHAPRPASAGTRGTTHRIPVCTVEPLTPDSVMISFDVPSELRDDFRFQPGQHLTIHHHLGGRDIRRNYSICTSAAGTDLAIAVRHVPGGLFSTFATHDLRAGDVLEIGTPAGNFGAPIDPLAQHHYLAVAAGSGITPVLSVLRTTLEIETGSRVTLIYGNRTAHTTMFLHELDELERRYDGRLRVIHVRSADTESPTLRGRIDFPLVQRIVDDLDTVHRWFLCGPYDLVTGLRDNLVERGVHTDAVHLELFRAHSATPVTDGLVSSDMTITLGVAEHQVHLNAGETVIEAVLRNKIAAPYACLGGACGTCTARVTAGRVSMDQNFALASSDVDAGRVLTCQSRPLTPQLRLTYEN